MTTRDRSMLMGIALLAIVGGFWMLALAPRRQQRADLQTKLSAARAELVQAERAATATPRGVQQQEEDAALAASVGKALPDNDQTASLIYQLQDAAGRSRVAFNQITPNGANGAPSTGAAVPGPAGVQELPLTLTFDGRYADLERFLRRVERFTSVTGQVIRVRGRLLDVRGIDLAASPAGFPHIRATITASAFVAGSPAAGPAGAQPTAQGTQPTAPGAAGTSTTPSTATATTPTTATAAPAPAPASTASAGASG